MRRVRRSPPGRVRNNDLGGQGVLRIGGSVDDHAPSGARARHHSARQTRDRGLSGLRRSEHQVQSDPGGPPRSGHGQRSSQDQSCACCGGRAHNELEQGLPLARAQHLVHGGRHRVDIVDDEQFAGQLSGHRERPQPRQTPRILRSDNSAQAGTGDRRKLRGHRPCHAQRYR